MTSPLPTSSDSSKYPLYTPSIPYTDPPTRLQTLSLWLPRPLPPSTTSSPDNDSDDLTWIFYLHGGAWRDPLQTSSTIQPTLTHLSSPSHAPAVRKIAGIASINYRLSAYPAHPTDPSNPEDEDRNVRHPSHVRDVARAVKWVVKRYGVRRWVGVGHSCGGTLWMQYLSGIGLEEQDEEKVAIPRPSALVCLEAIYSLPSLLQHHSPPRVPLEIADIYATFVSSAFGPPDLDMASYAAASPTSGTYSQEQVGEGGMLVVLGHSEGDELVEGQQREEMVGVLRGQGWVVRKEGEGGKEEGDKRKRVVEVRDLKGGHDEVWEDGRQIAELIAEVVGRLG